MKTCPYCGSNLEKLDTQFYYCEFCSMEVDSRITKENRERLDVRFQDFVLEVFIDKTTPEIMILSTFELLYLMKLIRKERYDCYHLMNVFHQAGKEGITEYKEVEKETGRDYMYYTKKAFIVENLIRTRLGYVPERITESYLVQYLQNIKNDKKTGPMMIRTQRKELNKNDLIEHKSK
ncbi:hypothetical protein J7E79_26415 [Bacillus sp. ISL-40]|uniref:hypothetical protein n=1 Tax=Bacillus sp. ISL-40 TaxID=2819126 RepID=UPI001BE7B853|nr:hypothetical protein [Bacillus sp. ISL-40]MBT2700861.1 hypothetical protein [Bacillus sp. ISL-40]